MTTIQGLISKLVCNSNTMFESLSYISSNVANSNTNSYKTRRFESFMGVDGSVQGVVRTDQSVGDLVSTFRQLDVAVDGAGFIPVTDLKGNTVYTRDGSFAVNSEGYMVSSNGLLVGSGIKLPVNYESDGTVLVLPAKATSFEEIGKIPLVSFKNPEGLEIEENNMVKETEKSGKPELIAEHLKIKQGKLEKANFNAYEFVNETLKINGSILSSTRLIKVLDDIYRESINLRQ